jgi:hypothetical protein
MLAYQSGARAWETPARGSGRQAHPSRGTTRMHIARNCQRGAASARLTVERGVQGGVRKQGVRREPQRHLLRWAGCSRHRQGSGSPRAGVPPAARCWPLGQRR